MEGNYNSHVILSQTLLNGFSHKTQEGKKIYVMENGTGNIIEEKVKEFNAVERYFDENNERYLCDNIETYIGMIRKLLIDLKKGSTKKAELNKNKLFELFNFQFLRNPAILDSYNKISKVSPVFGPCSPDLFLNFLKDTKYKHFSDKDYDVNVLINHSNIGLVTNSAGFYEASAEGNQLIVMPLNSMVALVLYKKGRFNKDGHVRLSKDEDVKNLNKFAYSFENKKIGKTIGKMDDLLPLKSSMKTNVKI